MSDERVDLSEFVDVVESRDPGEWVVVSGVSRRSPSPRARGLLALRAKVERLRERLDAAVLSDIEARNPGIDIEEVRRHRTLTTPEQEGT